MLTINYFLTAYGEPSYQASLNRLYTSLGSQSPDEWAKGLYLTLRDDPTHEQFSVLNRDRKACLSFVYKLVDAWEESADPEVFLQEIVTVFQVWRLRRILYVCLPMDRAQSLYKMQIATSKYCGMHWFSKLHLTADTPYAKAFPQEQESVKAWLLGYAGSATMNKRLFKLLYTESLGLLHEPSMARWSRPAPAVFLEIPDPAGHTVTGRASDYATPHGINPLALQEQPRTPGTAERSAIQVVVDKFVQAYDEPDYQMRLARLYNNRGSKDPEEWARELYSYPSNHRVGALNQDRKVCLDLLYALVDEWEKHWFSLEFEQAIGQVFKVRRLRRILGVCLVMDRAQALYHMRLPHSHKAGMHWYSSLHIQNGTFSSVAEQNRWIHLLADYAGRGTMNTRLYRLLYSNILGLQEDDLLAAWSVPQAA